MRRGRGQGLRRFSIGCTHGRTAVCGKLSGRGGAARERSAGRDRAIKAWEEVMASKLALDPRVDPRIKAVFATFELPTPTSVASREETSRGRSRRISDRHGRRHKGVPGCHGYGNDRAVHRAECPHRAVHLLARWQFGQYPVHPAGERQDPTVRLLHSRRRDGDDVLLLWQLPRLGPDDCSPRRRGGDGRFPQRGPRFDGAGSRTLSGRSQRLCLGPEVGPCQCGETGHRH